MNKTLRIRWHFHLVLLPEQPWGEELEREWGTTCSSLFSLPHGPYSLSRIPQDSYFFLSAADVCSSGTSYVISFRWRHISFRAQWHVSAQQSLQKGSLNLVKCSHLQLPCEVSWAPRREEVRDSLPLLQLPLSLPLTPPYHVPGHQVQRMALWTAAAKLSM